MAFGADFDMQLFAHRGPGLKCVAAGTSDCDLAIVWMYLRLNLSHFLPPYISGMRLNAIVNHTSEGLVGQVFDGDLPLKGFFVNLDPRLRSEFCGEFADQFKRGIFGLFESDAGFADVEFFG